MKKAYKKKEEKLTSEGTELRQPVAELEKLETDHKHAGQLLGKTEDDKLAILNSMSELVAYQDADHRIIWTNKAAAESVGLTAARLVGRHCYEIWHQRSQPCVGCPVAKTRQTGKPQKAEMTTPDGRVWLIKTYPTQDAYGSVTGVVEVTLDITERKQAEEALQTERNKLQSVIGAMEYDLTIQDKDYNIIYQNEPSRLSSGGNHVGEKCYRAYEGRDKICDGCPVEKAFKDGKSHTVERSHALPSGEIGFFENTANPIRDASGKIVSCLEIGRNITERKQAEEKLQTILKTALDGFWLTNLEGKLLEVNDSYCKMVGYTREELLKMSISDLEAIESPRGVTQHIKRITEQGFDSFESRHKRKDGKIIDVEISVNYLDVGEGQLFVFARDITERKQAEQTLRDSEEKTRKMFESVSCGISVVDLNGVITEVNRRTLEIHSLGSKDEILGKNAFDIVAPRDRDKIARNMLQALKRGTVRDQEYTLLRSDGSEFPAELSTSVLKDSSGKAIGHITIARDITKRKQAEEALQSEKNKLQSLIDALGDDLGIQDKDYNIIYQNEPSKAHFGDRLGEKCYRAYEGKDKVSDDCPVKKAFKDGKSHTSEREVITPSGEVTYWENTANPIRDASGEIVACIEVGRNITERKQAEQREKELQKELLLSSRLAAIGELAAGVAHQLNNPLTGVLGFSQRMLRKSTDEEASRNLERIHTEAERAAKVVHNLLTFARRRQPHKQYSDTNEILESALELRAYELKTSNIKVITNLAPGLPEVMVDFHQIEEVFLNIILNAEQAMTEANSGGKLTIKTEERKEYIRTTFTDDGPGIPAEHLDKIFDPFYTTKGEKGGTGLGLSVCHGIITEHGGKIYARSKPGKGTTFFTELPLTHK